MEADLERAKKEIEQLKTDHEVSLERKDKEVSHLDLRFEKAWSNCRSSFLDSPSEDTPGEV